MNQGSALWLAIILGSGFFLRLWGIDFGLPNTEARPDEGVLVRKALAVADGDLNPHFFNYPSFHIYTLAGLFSAYYVMGWLSGGFLSTQDFLLQHFIDPSPIYLTGRLLNAFLGTATVFLTYLLARQLGGIKIGLFSAAFLSVSFLHVRDSHYLTVDVPATFYLLLSVVLLLRFFDRKHYSWLIVSALFAGLAVSTKYNLAILVTVVMAYFAYYQSQQTFDRDRKWVHVTYHTLIFAAVSVFAAVCSTPYAVLDAETFLHDVMSERQHFAAGHGLNLGWGWSYHALKTLPVAMGWIAYGLSCVGCILLFRSGGLHPLIPTIILSYLAVAGSGKTVFFRYMIPILPFLCVAAGYGSVRLFEFFKVKNSWSIVATTLIVIFSAHSSVRLGMLLVRTDTRIMAADWIERNIPSGSKIAMVGRDFGYPQIHPSKEWLRQQFDDLRRAGKSARGIAVKKQLPFYPPDPNYYIVSVRPSNPLALSTIRRANLQELMADGVDWVVTQQHSLPYSQIDSNLSLELDLLSDKVVAFSSLTSEESKALFEMTDAFYLPYSGFDSVNRPGPNISIHTLK